MGGLDDPAEPVPRPSASPPLLGRLATWVEWLGAWRLAATTLALAAVCVGAWWLVRTPAPPTESALPYAAGAPASQGTGTGTTAPSSESTPPSSAAGPTTVTVHVAGAVARPGVYELPAASRVDDAVAAAGGATRRADLDGLNLAAVAVDGAQIYVPRPGEEVVVSSGVPDPGTAMSAPIGSTPQVAVDVNSADATELDTLPGVGPATAAAIIQHRDENGPFASVDDLESVPGIGPAKLEAMRQQVTV